jgi:hypothetical protein
MMSWQSLTITLSFPPVRTPALFAAVRQSERSHRAIFEKRSDGTFLATNAFVDTIILKEARVTRSIERENQPGDNGTEEAA